MLISLYVWISFGIVLLLWFVLLAIVRVFDRDPVHYKTGYLFRKIGNVLTFINPSWKLHISGEKILEPRKPFVVICNHQSMADIPLISNLPLEMKWLAKKELFKIPIVGWMLRMAGDIPVDRKNPRSGAQALIKALHILENKCSVMIFPEGTRTLDGRVRAFTDGAFHLAIKAKVPILPLVIDGSLNCIPKNSWKFGKPSQIFLKVLPPIDTSAFDIDNVIQLKNTARNMILRQIAEWRNVAPESVDGLIATSN